MKLIKVLLLATAFSLSSVAVNANPIDGTVASGNANIINGVGTVDIFQSTDKAVIDWKSFDIALGEKTSFYQPSSNSVTLNRINSNNLTTIAGQLTANGNIILVNPNGVFFTATSKTDVNGIIATTTDISDSNFMSGNMLFDIKGKPDSTVRNDGIITAGEAGLIGLVAPNVENNGVISANLGRVELASGDSFTVDFYGDGLIEVALSDDVASQLISNTGNIEAGTIIMNAATGNKIVSSIIRADGELKTPVASQVNGKIVISGDIAKSNTYVSGKINSTTGGVKISSHNIDITGSIKASGDNYGVVEISATNISNQGSISSDGDNGKVDISFSGSYIDSEDSIVSVSGINDAGDISLIGTEDSRAFISGDFIAKSENGVGGNIDITAGSLGFYGANIIADGSSGGNINIGGEFQGGGDLMHSDTTDVNFSSLISAKGLDGDGGNIVIWSDESTRVGGTINATGTEDGGFIEVSSKDSALVSEHALLNAASLGEGRNGDVLLDPANIVIADGGITGVIDYFEYLDPNGDINSGFGDYVATLSNGNIVITAPSDSFNASSAGAVYLFNGTTGSIISTLRGSQSYDRVGIGGVTKLTNGNYVISSTSWKNGANSSAGAVTWGSGITGVSGVVSSANSLVGSNVGEAVGQKVYALSNGNYVTSTIFWQNTSTGGTDAGAITWGNGTTGTTGAVSSANSIVGVYANDKVGYDGIVELTNGNYLIISRNYYNKRGAVTWASGTSATTGQVSSLNSLIGSKSNDMSASSIFKLSNGNYVVVNPYWDNGGIGDAGAVTWGSGTSGAKGVISSSNSLVGSTASDYVGSQTYNGIYEVAGGNYIVISKDWDNAGVANAGAVTWGSGTAGVKGTISAANSLVGFTSNERLGNIVTVLSNGNYVVADPYWSNGGVLYKGAVTYINGNVGLVGNQTVANSIVGTVYLDKVGSGGVYDVGNGDYVISSPAWDNGAVTDVGAVTYVDTSVSTVGVVSNTNSLIGQTSGDGVGNGIGVLSNGDYVVVSSSWDNGALTDAGAVTYVHSAINTTGVVTSANSIIGEKSGDKIGSNGIKILDNDAYLILSNYWDNGAVADAGAITYMSAYSETTGTVNATNSLVGSTTGDFTNAWVTFLTNGNYTIALPYWDNGAATDAGAVTWGSKDTGVVGTISSANSLVGSTQNDYVGKGTFSNYGVQALANGNYAVYSYSWDNGSIANAGAVTIGNGLTGISGVLSQDNSIVGASANDQVGYSRMIDLSNNKYALVSNYVDGNGVADVGAVTLIDGTLGTVGTISAVNSLMSATASSSIRVAEDTVNNKLYSSFITNSQNRTLLVMSTDNPYKASDLGFAFGKASNITLAPSFLTGVLNTGTNLTLQASNDITFNSDVIVNNAAGDGGSLTIQAGRSILVNSDIVTDNGNLNLYANDTLANGVVNQYRTAGDAVISMAAGSSIDVGSGVLTIELRNGAGLTNSTAGDISLRDIVAGSVNVRTLANTSDIVIQSGSVSASSSGNAIILASSGDFINNSGATALDTNNGRWLIYSSNPSNNTIGGLTYDFKRYSCTYGGSCPALTSGNGLLYSTTPQLTVTVDDVSAVYGDSVVLDNNNYSISGYLEDDNLHDVLSGAIDVDTAYTSGDNVGLYNITYNSHTLASEMGYGFTYVDGNVNVTPYAINVTASETGKIYGDADGILNFNHSALVAGDDSSVFSGTLSREAGENVGVYAIEQGSLSAGNNYTITYNGNNFEITPRSLSVSADAITKSYGADDPELTYTYSGLVNSDTNSVFSGLLSREVGENGGDYNILLGTLDAGSNYIIDFHGNTFKIERKIELPPPVVTIVNDIGKTPIVSGGTSITDAGIGNLGEGGSPQMSVPETQPQDNGSGLADNSQYGSSSEDHQSDYSNNQEEVASDSDKNSSSDNQVADNEQDDDVYGRDDDEERKKYNYKKRDTAKNNKPISSRDKMRLIDLIELSPELREMLDIRL